MKTINCVLAIGFLASLLSCNQHQIKAKREGLIPVHSEVKMGTFGLEAEANP